MNAAVSALRFFFGVTLQRNDANAGMTTVREPNKLPVVLSPQEVERLRTRRLGSSIGLELGLWSGPRGGGIDSERIGSAEQGKGRKDRYAMLPPTLLDLLRAWWLAARERGVMLPGGWLFPGQNPVNPLAKAHLPWRQGGGRHRQARLPAHTQAGGAEGRHRVIQVLLGHKKLDTTARYAQVAQHHPAQRSRAGASEGAARLTRRRHAGIVGGRGRLPAHGPAWRRARAGHLSLGQLKVMSAIEHCRTAALGGHVAACEKCGHTHIAYNSCRNRHCPKCQGAAAKDWLAARQAELLPVEYYHVVFTLPAPIADIAYHNKAVIYGILFKAAAETLITIARDPKHLGARIGLIGVLHTWGSALTHHPHLHCIVPGGGLSPDGGRWISCRPGFFLPVRVLSRLFRRLFLDKLAAAHDAGRLRFFGNYRHLADAPAFAGYLGPLRKVEWVVYAKRPFAGPEAVLAYLSRYTHRVAIANSRLISLDDRGVTFTWKDYRIKGRRRRKIMTLATDEFIRRFLIHVLPTSFHRIRHYGLFANGGRAENLATVRELLALPQQQDEEQDTGANPGEPPMLAHPCPCCGGPMIIIETFERGARPRAPPPRRRTGTS